jgi:hypothetical protein
MAVENKYVDSLIVAGKKTSSAFAGAGEREIVAVATFEVAAADDDASVYRVFKSVPSHLIPTEVTIATDGITGGTDYDLGLYKTDLGAVIDKDVLMDGQTLASALTRATGHALGLSAVNIDAVKSSLATLSAQTTPDTAYDIALTANTVGTGAGTVTVIAKFVQA